MSRAEKKPAGIAASRLKRCGRVPLLLLRGERADDTGQGSNFTLQPTHRQLVVDARAVGQRANVVLAQPIKHDFPCLPAAL